MLLVITNILFSFNMSKNFKVFVISVMGEVLHTHIHIHIHTLFVENNGVEPLTPSVQSKCSSQLS